MNTIKFERKDAHSLAHKIINCQLDDKILDQFKTLIKDAVTLKANYNNSNREELHELLDVMINLLAEKISKYNKHHYFLTRMDDNYFNDMYKCCKCEGGNVDDITHVMATLNAFIECYHNIALNKLAGNYYLESMDYKNDLAHVRDALLVFRKHPVFKHK